MSNRSGRLDPSFYARHSPPVQHMLREATWICGRSSRQQLIALLEAQQLPILEPVLAFEESHGGLWFEPHGAVFGTTAVLERGFRELGLKLVDGRTVVCVGYVYPMFLAVAEDGRYPLVELNLDDDEAPLEVLSEADDPHQLIELVPQYPRFAPHV